MSDGQVVIDTDLDTSGIESGLNKLDNLVKTGMKAAVTAITAVGTALTAAAGYAVKVGSDFESGMSEVSAISGATGDELEALTAKAKEMGASTKFSATESAEAFKYMAMAGWDSEQMCDGIAGVMNLAAASGEDLATTSDIVTDALTAFGLQASDSSHFADVLAMASNKANTNVSLMGETFKYVAPVAGALGYSIEDMSTAIGIMANSGIKGSEAGTALRSVLSRMASPTSDTEAAMTALGLSLTNADGSMKSFNEVMTDMRKGFSGLTADQKASYAAMLGGQEAMSGLLAIANASDNDFNSLSDALNNCDGAAQNMADTMNDNLQGQITLLKSAVEGLGIEVYEGLQEPLKNLAKQGSSYVNELSEAFQSSGLNGLVAELGDVFADVAIEASEAAPKMVQAGADMLVSFNDGLSKNTNRLVVAGKNIVFALVKGIGDLADSLGNLAAEACQAIIKELFGSKISSAFNKFVNTAKKSLTSIQTSATKIFSKLSTMLGNAIATLSKIGSVILPALAKAIEVVADNFNILLPLVLSCVVAFKTYTIISSIVTSITAMSKALEGATVAQKLLNLAMSANPYILAATAVAALVTAFVAFNLEKPISQSERLKEAQEEMSETFGKVGEAVSDYQSKIDGATGILDSLTSSAVVSSEKQQELSDQMESVQAEITDIFEQASEERRSLTQSEIDALEELMNKEQELADQQLDYEQAYQDAVKTKAEVTAQTHYNSISEYEDYAAQIAKSAEDTKDTVIQTAEDQYTQEILNLKNKLDTCADYTQEAYEEDLAAAQQRHDAAVDAANQECSDTYAVLADGYYNNSTVLQSYNENVKSYIEERNQIESDYNEKHQELQDELDNMDWQHMDNQTQTAQQLQQQLEDLEADHDSKMADLEERRNANFSDAEKDQLGTWTDMAMNASEYGGECENKVSIMADDIDDILATMDDATREKFQRAWEAAEDETDSAHSTLISKAADIATGMMNKLKSVFDIHSPSRKMRKIFNYVMQGGEVGMDDETDSMYDQVDDIAQNVMDRFNGTDIDTSALVSKMQDEVSAEAARLSANVTSSVIQTTDDQSDDTEQPNNPIVINVPLTLEGREIAKATATYDSAELATSIKRRR